MTPRWLPILTGFLAVALVVTGLGWALSGRTGRGTPLECYALGNGSIDVSPVHQLDDTLVTFTVAESDTKVVIGYFEEKGSGSAGDLAYDSSLSYVLTRPLGNRPVVDPSGQPIKKC
jgi:hypothetical protein